MDYFFVFNDIKITNQHFFVFALKIDIVYEHSKCFFSSITRSPGKIYIYEEVTNIYCKMNGLKLHKYLESVNYAISVSK